MIGYQSPHIYGDPLADVLGEPLPEHLADGQRDDRIQQVLQQRVE